jgi:hypothetical protein
MTDDPAALKRTNLGLILEIRRLKEKLNDRGEELPEETPRQKAIREAVFRLNRFQAGSPEYQAELAKVTAEHAHLIAAEVAETTSGYQAKLESRNRQIVKLMRSAEASKLASRMARGGSANVLQQLIADRIDVVPEGDDHVVKFRLADGTETTADGVAEEFLRDPALSPLIRDSKVLSAQSAAENARRVAETLARAPTTPIQHR